MPAVSVWERLETSPRCFGSSDNNEVADGGDMVRALSEEAEADDWTDDAAMDSALIENRIVVWLQRLRVCRSTGQKGLPYEEYELWIVLPRVLLPPHTVL